MHRNTKAGALAAAALMTAFPAAAHVVVGDRTFPVTLTFDDPGVGDEMTLPQVIWQRSGGPTEDLQTQWEFDKTITPTTALIYNHGFDILRAAGARTHSGFENVVITGKWQAFTLPEREFVASFGVQREMSGSIATQNIGGDQYGATLPTIYFGKGLGDLPIGVFRPLAVTGEVSYVIPDRRLNANQDNNGSAPSWKSGLSVQYSIPYLQAQVKDYGLPAFIGGLIPLVELTYSSPAAGPAPGTPMALMVGAGAGLGAGVDGTGAAVRPPSTTNTSENPIWRSQEADMRARTPSSSTSAMRAPRTATQVSVACTNWPPGAEMLPWRWPAAYSVGSRTSST